MKEKALFDARLLEQFREFHQLLSMRIRGVTEASRREELLRDAVGSPAEIRHELLSLLERQATEAGRFGGEHGATRYLTAQFVMAALADELMLRLRWEGREYWKVNLLEQALFGSHQAGTLLFEKLDRLLAENDPNDREMAAIFLQALSLGFRGGHRGEDGPRLLGAYRKKLHGFIYGEAPAITDSATRLFPDAYDHTVVREERGFLPPVTRWGVIFAALLLLYLAGSHHAWRSTTAPIREITSGITEKYADHLGRNQIGEADNDR